MVYYLPTKISRGFGIEVLDIKNKCLLSKCHFKLINEDGMWQELLHNNYLRTKTLSPSKTHGLSFLEGDNAWEG
jgi:hypothetical protein